MSQLPKIKHIFPRYFAVFFSLFFGLSFLRWFLDVRLHWLPFKEEMLDIWFPAAVCWLAALIFLRKPLRILKVKRSDSRTGILAVTIVTIAFPVLFFQRYVVDLTGNLIELKRPTEIFDAPVDRYYTVENYYVEENLLATYRTSHYSGKNNSRFHMTCYHVYPMLDADTVRNFSAVWLGIEKTESIAGSSPDKEWEQEQFFKRCLEDLKEEQFYSYSYFLRTPNNEDRDGFMRAVELHIPNANAEKQIILEPRKEKFENRLEGKFTAVLLGWCIPFLIFAGIVLILKLDSTELENQKSNKKPALDPDDFVHLLQYLIPRGNHIAQALIVDANILLYLIMVIAGVHAMYPSGEDLVNWGSLYTPLVEDGQYWRLITASFLHAGLIHLVLNIGGFVLALILLEDYYDQKRFVMLYFTCVLGASLTSLFWHDVVNGVGASGGVFGLFGATVSLVLRGAMPFEIHKPKFMLVLALVGINLLFGMTSNVDNAAHLGGFATGILFGSLLALPSKKAEGLALGKALKEKIKFPRMSKKFPRKKKKQD